jgi:CHAD domain-containing protein
MFDRFGVGNSTVMAVTLQRERSSRVGPRFPPPKFDGAAASGKAHSSPAQRAVAEYLNAQIDRIDAGDAGLRRGFDPIHDTRVAIRRMRSTLRVFAKLFDRAAATELESELKWFAAVLGEVRDCQVQRKRFGAALDRLPDELVLGPVRSDIRITLRGIERPARSRVTDAMDSERYVAMMAALRGWRTEPPLKERFGVDDLRKYFKKARRKADRRLAAAVDGDDDAVLHAARKAAKRARYAGELCGAVHPPAGRKAKAYKKVQSVLGDHQDTVVARDVLRRMAAGTGPSRGQNGFTYGLLYAREQQMAAETRLKATKLAKGRS